jgi:two-component system, chemotaxis family, chemotaxis protein CheY
MSESPPTPPIPLILVVDDDVDIRSTVAGILQDEGYRVLTASNGKEALTTLTAPGAARPDLILLDLMMPIMDGATFHDHFEKVPAVATIPILTFTAFGAPADVPWAAGRLSKPLRLEALLSLIEKHVGPPPGGPGPPIRG